LYRNQIANSGQIGMCRNIKTLFNFEPPVVEDEIRAAALQFVRKISGFNKPSKSNEPAFNAAVDDITLVANRLLRSLETTAVPKNRQDVEARAKALSVRRFGNVSGNGIPADIQHVESSDKVTEGEE
jgi:hypothetical protein